MPWFPILLAVHISLAISLLLPSLLLPFLLRRDGGGETDGVRTGALTRVLLAMSGTGSVVIGVGLALSGAGLLAILGPDLLQRPWLLAALGIYAANLLVAAFISRPNLRRLVGAGGDPATWRRRAARQRYIAYAMAGATGLIGFLMSAKPEF